MNHAGDLNAAWIPSAISLIYKLLDVWQNQSAIKRIYKRKKILDEISIYLEISFCLASSA